MSASQRLQDGQPFGRYQIVRLLGEGGMGAVYEAIHPILKKRFAIKTLLPSIAEMPEARARFLREGEAASRINHPNVVDVSDVGTEAGVPYLVMEFLEGETLGELMASRGRLEVKEAVDLLLPVVSAVAAGHDHGVVHRDLKPANVFLARGPWGERVPKVLDFGVSKLVGEGDSANLTGTMAFLGTAAYMSPEQARGARRVDAQSDQYALGLILYEMLTGVRAHHGEHPLEVLHNVNAGVMVPARELRPDLPEPLLAVLTRMLALTPTDRYPALRAVGRALLPLAGDKVRATMSEAFRETPSELGAQKTAIMPVAPAAGGTQMLPESSESPASQPPTKPARADTTLGQTASEVGAAPAARRARGAAIAAGVAVAVVAVGAFAVVGRKSPPPVVPAASARAPAVVAPAPVVQPPAPPPAPPVAPPAPEASPAPAEKPAAPTADHPKKTPRAPKTSHSAAAKPAAAPEEPKPNCDPNFTLDAQGEKHFKPECFLKR